MNRMTPQNMTGNMYEQNNQNVLQAQQMQAMQQQMMQQQPQYYAVPQSNGYAAQIPQPTFNVSNPFAVQEGQAQQQVQLMQQNMAAQNELRKLQSEGMTGFHEAMHLYKNLGNKNAGADYVTGLPYVAAFAGPKFDKLRNAAMLSASRSPAQYKEGFQSVAGSRHTTAAKKAALQIGEASIIDYLTGKIAASAPMGVYQDANVIKAVARSKAENMMRFYVENLLPSKTIRNGADLEKIMNSINNIGGDDDFQTVSTYLDTVKRLGAERYQLDEAVNEMTASYKDTRDGAYRAINAPYVGEGMVPIRNMIQDPEAAEGVGAIVDFVKGFGGGLVKEAGGLFKTISVDIFGKGLGALFDITTGGDAGLNTVEAISDKFNKLLEPSGNAGETIARLGVQGLLAIGIGTALLPGAGLLAAAGAGAAVNYIGMPAAKGVFSLVTDTIGDMLFPDENSRNRRLYNALMDVSQEALTIVSLHKLTAMSDAAQKGVLSDAIERTDAFKQLPQSLQKSVLDATKEVSANELQRASEFAERFNLVEQEVPMDKILAIGDLVDAYPEMKMAKSYVAGAQQFTVDAGTTLFREMVQDRNILSEPGASRERIQNTAIDLSGAVSESYDVSLNKSLGQTNITLDQLVSRDIVDGLLRNKELYKHASDAIYVGIRDVARRGMLPEKEGILLADLFMKNPEEFMFRAQNMKVPLTAIHWIKHQVTEAIAADKGGAAEMYTTREVKGVLNSNLERHATPEQMSQYKLAQAEHGMHQDFLKVFRNNLDEWSAKADVVTLANSMPQIYGLMNDLIIKGEELGASSKVQNILMDLRDDLSSTVYLETINRKQKWTSETLSTLEAKLTNLQGANPQVDKAIKTSLHVMENLIGSTTKGKGLTSTGSYANPVHVVADGVVSWILSKFGSAKNYVLNKLGVQKGADAYVLGQLADRFIENPALREAVDLLMKKDAPFAKAKIYRTLGLYGMLNMGEDYEQ